MSNDASDCSPAVVYGSGRHIETISAAEMVEFVKVQIHDAPESLHLFLRLPMENTASFRTTDG
jgi:hypothetical protein